MREMVWIMVKIMSYMSVDYSVEGGVDGSEIVRYMSADYSIEGL